MTDTNPHPLTEVEVTDLLDLAARVEAAEGPDTLLDDDIHDAIGLSGYRKSRRYTASLDAAMTLVPEEWFYCVLNARGLEDAKPTPGYGGALVGSFDDISEAIKSEAATPALALTAAALRARSVQL